MRTILKAFATALVALLVYVAVEHGGDAPRDLPSGPGAGPVTGAAIRGRARVVDADTLEIASLRIRLHGIDAPEREQNCTRSGFTWPCGHQASAALAGLVAGRDLRCDPRDRDRYDRVVAVCWMNDVDVNRWLVDQGWALAYRRFSTAYVGAEDAARHARRGIWIGSFETPEDYRRRQPERRRF